MQRRCTIYDNLQVQRRYYPNPIPSATLEPQLQEVQSAPDQLQDQLKPQAKEMEEVNLAWDGEEVRLVFISMALSQDLRNFLLKLLKKYQDVFAWTYDGS